MANIGSFKRVEDGTISGEIRTLRFKTSARFIPVEDKTSEQAPDFRLFAPGKVELGAAWKKVSDAGLIYYSVSLDDPVLPGPGLCGAAPDRERPRPFQPRLVPPAPAGRQRVLDTPRPRPAARSGASLCAAHPSLDTARRAMRQGRRQGPI